jgi:hypothetical protein
VGQNKNPNKKPDNGIKVVEGNGVGVNRTKELDPMFRNVS